MQRVLNLNVRITYKMVKFDVFTGTVCQCVSIVHTPFFLNIN